MYKSLNYRGEAPVVTAFGKSLTLGGPVKLTDRPIFEAETPKRTYWRAAVFDSYTGQKWLNTDHEIITRERNEPLGEPPFYASREITVTIHPLQDRQEVVFTPPHPLRITLPIIADVSKVPRSDDGEGLVTVSLIRSRLTLTRKNSYQVAAAISLATPNELRAAPAVYPAWIIKRYLQLPDTLPPRVVRMAQEITAPYANPYDKASALETRLREYTYNEKIKAPPKGRDGVDYFLFGVKAGYCNYYASALAVMLRAVGIPTRFVVGYTPGQSVPPPDDKSTTTDMYQVQERDAHAWTEVWFPTYGWIQFEPTASEPLLVRPTANPTATPGAITQPFEDNLDELKDLRPERGNLGPSPTPTAPRGPIGWLQAHWVGLVLGIIGVLAIGVWLWMRRRRLTFFRDPELAARLFGLLGTWAKRLHIPWPASDTPLEHAAAFNRLLPEAQPTVGHLTALFVAQRYGRQRPSAEALADTMEDWKRLQPLFWRRWLGQLLSRLRRSLPLQ